MKFKYKITTPPHVQLGDISKFLLGNFSVEIDSKGAFLAINHDSSASKEESYADLQKEIDRIFFLTGIHIDSILKEIEDDDDGNTTMFQFICSSPSISANVAESLSAHRITTQQ